jgi:drug/metabolite transporter (DMT)-like permease
LFAGPGANRNPLQDRRTAIAHHRAMILGVLSALAAGMMWGLVFVAPLLLPEYPAALQSAGRYLAFGLLALPLAWFDRESLRRLGRADWLLALELAAIGNLIYYLCLAAAIQRADAPLPTLIVGTLPVTIALGARLSGRDASAVPWRRFAPAATLIVVGIGLVDRVEAGSLQGVSVRRVEGALLALAAVACWTWYPLRNAAWLRAHPDRNPRAWATAQGVATLPLALLAYAMIWLRMHATADPFPMPAGPRPLAFLGLMTAIGLFASWLGTLCWNEASRRLPTALVGQLIVFETLAALAYSCLLRQRAPEFPAVAGAALLIAGVILALRATAPRKGPSNPAEPRPPTPRVDRGQTEEMRRNRRGICSNAVRQSASAPTRTRRLAAHR